MSILDPAANQYSHLAILEIYLCFLRQKPWVKGTTRQPYYRQNLFRFKTQILKQRQKIYFILQTGAKQRQR